MSRTLASAFELLVQAEQLGARLEAAANALAQLSGVDEERTWIAAARTRLAGVQVDKQLLSRALRLSELSTFKAEHGKLLQLAVADEVERLQASITLVGGGRSPLLETLFHELKVPALRKCSRGELEKFCLELERRLGSSYARRLLGSERYASVVPTVKALKIATGIWASVFVDPPVEGADAEALRDELLAACKAVDLRVRQARLLAQAALLPAAELLDAAGVVTPQGKANRVSPDSHPMLEKDPPDPLRPTPEESAEISKLHASA